MLQRRTYIGSAQGLHARPASLLTQAVTASGHTISISRPDDTPVAANSTLMVMSLALKHGEEVVLSCPHDSGKDTLDELAELVETNWDAS
ncbi:HPr family phosphocarrier protein [Jonesia quinghaiensis]|uniref:HPr family phosphocarrier protein n=1 Tax=Jonesia quinghaiensis TaxID=262806 RepID=UPI0003F5C36E|nr:HPr family phosphocarrier protein [Jonesia quinghaiensis]